MTIEERLSTLKNRMKSTQSDDARYQVGEAIRDLGYIDFRDFCAAPPPRAHIDAIEQALGGQAA